MHAPIKPCILKNSAYMHFKLSSTCILMFNLTITIMNLWGKKKNSEETTKNLKQFSKPIFNQSITRQQRHLALSSTCFCSTRLTTTNVKQWEKKNWSNSNNLKPFSRSILQIFHQDYQFQRINLTCIDHTSFAAWKQWDDWPVADESHRPVLSLTSRSWIVRSQY